MKNLGLVSIILLCAFLASCQVKDGGGGDLVSGHLPATNTFTLATPAAKTYIAGETLSLTANFPFDMTIDTTGGTPRLALNINGVTRYATYAPQGDPRKLVFNYTFASESDSNGIDVTALQLNGSTCKYTQNAVVTDCNVSSITTTNFSGVNVDSTPPTVTAFSLTNPANVLYNVGEVITYTMQFSEAVTVTGTPRFPVTVNIGAPTTSVNVNYVSGSGSNLLTFTFTVASNHDDTNGYPTSGLIDLNGGTIKDSVGNNATLDFTSVMATANTDSATRDLNGIYPFVVSVTAPADNTYTVTQNLDFIVNFNRNVNISGTTMPTLPVTIGLTTRQAQYVSGMGTSALTFRYQVVPGDFDDNGVAIGTSITQNGGGINGTPTAGNYFGNLLNNFFTVPATPNVLVSAQQPAPISVARNVDTTNSVCTNAIDNFWTVGQDLFVSVVFNTPVYVNQVSGTPSVPLIFTSGTKQATYLSGGNGQTTLVFQYTIVDTDDDSDGSFIGLGPINLNGGNITDAANTNVTLTLPVATLANTQVDGLKPTITSVTAPSNGVYSTVTPLDNTSMTFTVLWSEAVRWSSTAIGQNYLTVDIGGTPTSFGTSGNNVASYNYRSPNAFTGLNDNNGVSLTSPLAGTATVQDCRGNAQVTKTFTLPTTTGILVDTTPPQLTNLAKAIVDGWYKEPDNLNFTATFSEPVTVQNDGTNPSIPIIIGALPRTLTASSAATPSTTHTFRYPVANNDLDADGVSVGTTLSQNGTTSYIQDAGRNLAVAAFTSPTTTGVLVDAVAPTITSVTTSVNGTPTTSGTFLSGSTLSVTLKYSEVVTVTGTPIISIDFDSGTDNLVYISGSGSDTIVFSRAVEFDMSGLPSSLDTITFPGGSSIRDNASNDGPSTFAAQNLSAMFFTYSAVKLWVRSDFVNMAPSPAVSVTNGGTITTQSCGTGTCRTFNGDDYLRLAGNLTNMRNVFIAAKTPNAVTVDLSMFTSNIRFDDMGSHYDLRTTNATVTSNGTTYNTNDTTHDTNFALNTTYVLQVIYQNDTDYFTGTNLIQTTFTGAIGEIIATDNSLLPVQRDNIRTYLEDRF